MFQLLTKNLKYLSSFTYLYIFIFVQDEEITASHEDTLLLLLLSLLHPDLPHLIKETYQPKIKGRYLLRNYLYLFPSSLYLYLPVSPSSLYLLLNLLHPVLCSTPSCQGNIPT